MNNAPRPDFTEISPAVVIGAGLIGASVGCALTRRNVDVQVIDVNGSHAVVASGRGAGSVEPIAPDDEIRLVVVAVPPASIAAVVAKALTRYPNAAVTDVGSVKSHILSQLTEIPGVERYVGSHPMAGSALSGPLTAAAELFDERIWVVTPSEFSVGWATDRVKTMVRSTRARMLIRSAEDHDRAVAEVSHLPQLMSSLTAARLAQVPGEDLQLAGQGVRDMTRIAGSEPELWRQIVAGNREQVRAQLMAVRDDLDSLIQNLDDPASVSSLVERGRRGASALPGRAGKEPAHFVSVSVLIPDAPGAMGRLFADISEIDVNVEDIAIEHDPTQPTGALVMQVRPEQVDALRALLRQRGWANG